MSTDHSDFIARLRQIEELASLVHSELPQRQIMLRTRIQHVVVLAKTLRGRLELGGMAVVRVDPGAPSAAEPKKPPL